MNHTIAATGINIKNRKVSIPKYIINAIRLKKSPHAPSAPVFILILLPPYIYAIILIALCLLPDP
jgi:hypothetical protein